MKFSTASTIVLAAAASTASASIATTVSAIPVESNCSNVTELTSTAIVSDIQTTVLTITDCGNKTCTPKHVTTGVTVVTETRELIVTEYTTYCPITTSTKGNYSITPLIPLTSGSAPTAKSEAPIPKSEVSTAKSETPKHTSTSSSFSSIIEGNAASNSLLGLTPAIGLVVLFMF